MYIGPRGLVQADAVSAAGALPCPGDDHESGGCSELLEAHGVFGDSASGVASLGACETEREKNSTRADPAHDQCGDASVACPFPSCKQRYTDVKALRMHYRDVHNKNGRADRDGLDAVLFPATDFCVECGCGPYTRLNSHVCKEANATPHRYLCFTWVGRYNL